MSIVNLQALSRLRALTGARASATTPLDRKRANYDQFLRSIDQPAGGIGNGPLQLFLEVTTRCNLRCEKCLKRFLPEYTKGQELPFASLQQLTELYATAVEVNTFGEGEMFLYHDLQPLVRTLKQHGCKLSGITNGTRIKRDDVAWLVSTGFDQLTFSIDGATPATMRRLRGADLSHVLRVLSWVKEEKQLRQSPAPEIIVNFVAQKDNILELPELARTLSTLGIHFLGVNTLHALMHPAHASGEDIERAFNEVATLDFYVQMFFDYCVPDDQKDDITRAIDGLKMYIHYGKFYRDHRLSNVGRGDVEGAISEAQELARNAGFQFVSYVDLASEWAQNDGPRQETGQIPQAQALAPMYCLFPWTTLYISATMPPKPCCYMALRQQAGQPPSPEEVAKAWRGPLMTEVREHIRRGDVHPACRTCVQNHTYQAYLDALRGIREKLGV